MQTNPLRTFKFLGGVLQKIHAWPFEIVCMNLYVYDYVCIMYGYVCRHVMIFSGEYYELSKSLFMACSTEIKQSFITESNSLNATHTSFEIKI